MNQFQSDSDLLVSFVRRCAERGIETLPDQKMGLPLPLNLRTLACDAAVDQALHTENATTE
jgi:hypothetical protein